jgi:hypothetical protein
LKLQPTPSCLQRHKLHLPKAALSRLLRALQTMARQQLDKPSCARSAPNNLAQEDRLPGSLKLTTRYGQPKRWQRPPRVG